MGGKASRKDSSKSTSDEPFYERPSSSKRHSQNHFDVGEQRQRRSLSVATVVSESQPRKWSDSPMARKASDLEASEFVGSSSPVVSTRLLTVDNASGSRRSRQRSMSARKPNELRPHVELSPKQAAGGSVRMRRVSDTVNEIGQLRLTPVQIGMVRKLWQNVRAQGENGAGLQILRDHLFFRYPDIRDLFSTAGASSSETNYHKRLMAHAEALGLLLDEVIANLEQSHLLREKIRDLGRLHAKSRDIGFKANYWDRLAEAMNECTLTWCQKGQRCFEAQVAMTTIVMFIIDHLKDGYMEECRRLRRSMYDSGSRERKVANANADDRESRRSPRHHLACDD